MAVITFDFDDTLTQTQWDPEEENFRFVGPNLAMIKILREHLNMGDEVHIVTSRMGPANQNEAENASFHGQPAIGPFLREHLGDDLERMTGVHFTSGALKWKKLAELDSDRHFDDDPCELEALLPGVVGVRVSTLHGFE
jgi:hypothetical protein